MSARVKAYLACENCGIVFGRTRYPSGRLEQMSQFRKRRFCSRLCAVECTGAERAVPFWDRVDRSGGEDACWPWAGAINKGGYGSFACGDVIRTASRVAYESVNGPVPPGPGYHGCPSSDNLRQMAV